LKTIHTIPFSKKEIEELSQYFAEPLSFVLVDKTSGRKYSYSFEEFRDMGYDELRSAIADLNCLSLPLHL
jgi:hypothetical protein